MKPDLQRNERGNLNYRNNKYLSQFKKRLITPAFDERKRSGMNPYFKNKNFYNKNKNIRKTVHSELAIKDGLDPLTSFQNKLHNLKKIKIDGMNKFDLELESCMKIPSEKRYKLVDTQFE